MTNLICFFWNTCRCEIQTCIWCSQIKEAVLHCRSCTIWIVYYTVLAIFLRQHCWANHWLCWPVHPDPVLFSKLHLKSLFSVLTDHSTELAWCGWTCLLWAPPLHREVSFTRAYCITGPWLCGGTEKNIFKPSTSIRQPVSYRVCWSQWITHLSTSPGCSFYFLMWFNYRNEIQTRLERDGVVW